jgi:hypothetical protein
VIFDELIYGASHIIFYFASSVMSSGFSSCGIIAGIQRWDWGEDDFERILLVKDPVCCFAPKVFAPVESFAPLHLCVFLSRHSLGVGGCVKIREARHASDVNRGNGLTHILLRMYFLPVSCFSYAIGC